MGQNLVGKKKCIIAKLVIIVAFYSLAVRYNLAIQKTVGIATIYLNNESLLAETVRDICSREQKQETPLSLCFWGEQQNELFTCKETEKNIQATALWTEGNPELIVPGSTLLAWQEKGCFLDTVTAEELFGTDVVGGQLVWYNETAYTVYGTFESLRRTVVLHDTAETESKYTMLSVRATENRNLRNVTEQFLIRYGLAGNTIDFAFLGMISQNLLLLIPLLLAAGILKLLWNYWRSAASVYKKIVCVILMGLTIIAVWFLVRTGLQIPADMIPSKWSDFSFWSDWWEGQQKNLLRILGSAQGEMQLAMLWNFVLSFLFNLAAILSGISVLHTIE